MTNHPCAPNYFAHNGIEISTLKDGAGNTDSPNKLYHTTYFNHAKQWATRAKTADELAGIHYGAQLPEDLAANMAKVIASVSGQ